MAHGIGYCVGTFLCKLGCEVLETRLLRSLNAGGGFKHAYFKAFFGMWLKLDTLEFYGLNLVSKARRLAVVDLWLLGGLTF